MPLPDILPKIKFIMLEPALFFSQLKKETGVKTAFVYFLILSLWSAVLGLVVTLLFKNYSYNFVSSFVSKITGSTIPLPQQTVNEIIVWGILGYGLGLLLSFVFAGLLHGWIVLFGGTEKYAKTYQLSIYSSTPGLVLGWIPFIGFFIWIYDLVLLIIGTQKVHKISPMKSILMYVIPIVLMILFMAGILFLLFFIAQQLPALM